MSKLSTFGVIFSLFIFFAFGGISCRCFGGFRFLEAFFLSSLSVSVASNGSGSSSVGPQHPIKWLEQIKVSFLMFLIEKPSLPQVCTHFLVFSIFFPLSHWFFYVSWLWKSDEICPWWQLVWISWVILAVSPTTVFCWAFFNCSFTISTCHLCFFVRKSIPRTFARILRTLHYSIFSFTSERY